MTCVSLHRGIWWQFFFWYRVHLIYFLSLCWYLCQSLPVVLDSGVCTIWCNHSTCFSRSATNEENLVVDMFPPYRHPHKTQFQHFAKSDSMRCRWRLLCGARRKSHQISIESTTRILFCYAYFCREVMCTRSKYLVIHEYFRSVIRKRGKYIISTVYANPAGKRNATHLESIFYPFPFSRWVKYPILFYSWQLSLSPENRFFRKFFSNDSIISFANFCFWANVHCNSNCKGFASGVGQLRCSRYTKSHRMKKKTT